MSKQFPTKIGKMEQVYCLSYQAGLVKQTERILGYALFILNSESQTKTPVNGVLFIR